MRKLLTFPCVCLFMFTVYAQNKAEKDTLSQPDRPIVYNAVQKFIVGAQVGILGVWVFFERKLYPEIALRGELGFSSRLFGGNAYEGNGFILMPVIAVEPRWYYDLKRRASWGKETDYNSGNFLSLRLSYHIGGLAVSDRKNPNVVSTISIVPTWGIRRNIGKRFNVELAFGVGYAYIFRRNTDFSGNQSSVAINFQVRAGYRINTK